MWGTVWDSKLLSHPFRVKFSFEGVVIPIFLGRPDSNASVGKLCVLRLFLSHLLYFSWGGGGGVRVLIWEEVPPPPLHWIEPCATSSNQESRPSE